MQQPLRAVTRQILEAFRDRGTLHPRVDADGLGLSRERLDEVLDHLRLGGFVEIADWSADKGQGYRLTPAGHAALDDPRLIDRPPAALPVAPDDSPWAQGEAVLQAVVQPPPARVTPLLIALNVLVFALGAVLAPSWGVPRERYLVSTPIDLGILVPARVFVLGEWWRLITYGFLHAGAIHLAFNMFALHNLGQLLEARWGRVRFLILYLGSLVLAGCAVPLLQKDTGAVGASGAICGVLTSLAVWAWMYRAHLPPELVQAHFRAAGTNLFLILIISMMPGVSWTAHLGGALAGAILSIPLAWLDRHAPRTHQVLGIVTLLAIMAAALGALVVVVAPQYIARRPMLRLAPIDAALTSLFHDDAAPLLRKVLDRGEMPPVRLAALRDRFREGADACRVTATWIEREHASGPQQKARLAEQYRLRARIFEQMLDLLDRPDAWDEARRDALDREWGRIETEMRDPDEPRP